MTYNPQIPVGVISPQAQAPEIQTNFAQFASIFSTTIASNTFNHTAFNTPKQGDHETVVFEKQTTDPEVTNDLVILYSKDSTSAVDTEPQLFLRIPIFKNMRGNPPMQLTYNKVNIAGPVYQSFMAGGYLLFFGTITDITINITLIPTPTQILCAIANSNTMTTVGTSVPFNVSTQIISNDQFKINSSLNGSTIIPYSFTWAAIAKA